MGNGSGKPVLEGYRYRKGTGRVPMGIVSPGTAINSKVVPPMLFERGLCTETGLGFF